MQINNGNASNYTTMCPNLLESINATTFASFFPGLDLGHCLFTSILPSETVVQVLVFIFVMLTMFSLLMNGCALLGLGRSEDLSWEPRFFLLKNLILSDLLLIMSQGPTIIGCLLMRRTITYGGWCLTQFFLNSVCIFSAMITITCMALERYLYICQAIYYLHILTPTRLSLLLGLIWFISVIIPTVSVVLMSLGHRATLVGAPTTGLLCEPDLIEIHLGFPRAVAVYRKVSGLVVTALCIFSYAFSYFRMYQDACNAVQPFQQVNRKARNTVLFYCSMLLLQLLPVLLKIMSDAMWEMEGTTVMTSMLRDSQGWTPARTLHIMLLVLLQVPPCINPLIYGLRNLDLLQTLPRLLWWKNESQDINTTS